MSTSDAVWVAAWTVALAGVLVVSMRSARVIARQPRDASPTAAVRHLVTSVVGLAVLTVLAVLAPPIAL